MLRFHRLPGGLANAIAVDLRQHEKQLQLALGRVFVYTKDNTSHFLTVKNDPIGLSILPVNGILDGLARDDLFTLLATLVPHPKLLLGSVLERPLVVQDELLPVFGLQRKKYDIE